MPRGLVNRTGDMPDGRGIVNNTSPDGRALVNAYAKGTKNASKGAAMVGEKGKEIVVMKGGEKVIPNNKVSKYLQGKIVQAKNKKS